MRTSHLLGQFPSGLVQILVYEQRSVAEQVIWKRENHFSALLSVIAASSYAVQMSWSALRALGSWLKAKIIRCWKCTFLFTHNSIVMYRKVKFNQISKTFNKDCRGRIELKKKWKTMVKYYTLIQITLEKIESIWQPNKYPRE